MLITRPRRAGAAQGARARPVTEAAAPRPAPCGCALSRLVARARTVAWTFACPRRTSPMSVFVALARAPFVSRFSQRGCACPIRRAVRMLSGRTGYVSRKTIAHGARDARRPLPLALRPAKGFIWLCQKGYFPQVQDWSSLPAVRARAGTPSGGRVGLRLELARQESGPSDM